MKTTKKLILGKTYFCNWAWRYAKYIGTTKDEFGNMVARFKDICDCRIQMDASKVIDHIDWDKTKNYGNI